MAQQVFHALGVGVCTCKATRLHRRCKQSKRSPLFIFMLKRTPTIQFVNAKLQFAAEFGTLWPLSTVRLQNSRQPSDDDESQMPGGT